MIEVIKYIIVIFLIDQLLISCIRKSKPSFRKLTFFAMIVLIYAMAYQSVVTVLPENYFETFSLNRVFTTDKLRKSYRKLALESHPDRAWDNGNQTKNFQDIQDKYEILLDEKLRVSYDKFGPEIGFIAHLEAKKGRLLDHFQSHRVGILIKDGIFYIAFGIILIAISSEENLALCRKLCYALILAFFSLEVAFLWDEHQIYDIFDVIFPTTAIFERLVFMRYFIGIICVTIKSYFKLKAAHSSNFIQDKLEDIVKIQSEINSLIKTTDAKDIIKNVNGNEELKIKSARLNSMLKEVVQFCHENSAEKKKERRISRRRRIKTSLIILLGFVIIYYYANVIEI